MRDTSTPNPAERRGHVIRDYTAEFPDPITFQAGEAITLSDNVSLWDNNPDWRWLWCTDPRGKSGWTPATFFEASGRGQTAIARRDYAATELTATVGETLSITDTYGGWFWCANQRGQHGWIPQDHVSLTQS
jgi:hypothetical protein